MPRKGTTATQKMCSLDTMKAGKHKAVSKHNKREAFCQVVHCSVPEAATAVSVWKVLPDW